MPRKSADQWFAEYGESHQHSANELIHWVCVPLIFFSVLGFVWEIPIPTAWETSLPWFNWTIVAIAAATLFYAWLSLPLAVGMLAFMTVCQSLHLRLEAQAAWPVWQICLVIFVAINGKVFLFCRKRNRCRGLYLSLGWLGRLGS